MAVIITNMDMSKSCMDCPLTYVDTGDDAYFGASECRCVFDGSCIEGEESERQYDCPLKSADEMIAEIDKIVYTRTLTTNPSAQDNSKIVGYDSLMKVIHKYCDKEET